jgi:hypothetical protein
MVNFGRTIRTMVNFGRTMVEELVICYNVLHVARRPPQHWF